MHKLVPDIRWRQLVAAVIDKKVPEDLYLRRVYRVMIGEVQDALVAHTLDIINTPYERDYIVAYFLAGATPEYISKSLGLQDEVCRNFGHLYIDMNTFRYRLEVCRYAEYYMQNVAVGAERIDHIYQAVHQGPEYLTYILNPMVHERMEFEKMSSNLLSLACYTAGYAKTSDINSAKSKQALRWLGTATKLLTAVRDYGSSSDDDIQYVIGSAPQLEASVSIEKKDLVHLLSE